MSTIYLTNYQYRQILDGMVSTHVDVLDNNKDGILTLTGDGDIPVEKSSKNSQTDSGYVYARTDLIDKAGDDAYTDLLLVGLSGADFGYSEADIDFEGPLMGYSVEELNKIIDYYNNGGSWNDDGFDKIVYEGVGVLGTKPPEGRYKAGSSVLENHGLGVGIGSDATSLATILFENDIAEEDVADYTTDAQGRINSVTLKSGFVYRADYENKDKESYMPGNMIFDLQESGATNITFMDTINGYTGENQKFITGYTLGGTRYNISKEWYGDYDSAETEEYSENTEVLEELEQEKNTAEYLKKLLMLKNLFTDEEENVEETEEETEEV